MVERPVPDPRRPPRRKAPWRKGRKKATPLSGPPLVDKALRRLHILDKVRSLRALRAYSLACGPRFVERTRAERFQPDSGTLTIRLESSAWANEMVFVREAILLKLQQTPGGEGVRTLRFSIGPLGDLAKGPDALPDWIEPPPPPPPPRVPIPIDSRVAGALTQVPDDELRDALGALYVGACRAGRRP